DIVVSGEVKLLKPDPAIFELSLRRFRLEPRGALFVDDRLINVEAAASMGVQAHLFTGADSLSAELSSAGLL
ncbi:MAG: HAD-IA family hydrolase, partial [Sphingomonas sp.]|nr:HAD-IA family hydrolase [Sphingomonas sp.]